MTEQLQCIVVISISSALPIYSWLNYGVNNTLKAEQFSNVNIYTSRKSRDSISCFSMLEPQLWSHVHEYC